MTIRADGAHLADDGHHRNDSIKCAGWRVASLVNVDIIHNHGKPPFLWVKKTID